MTGVACPKPHSAETVQVENVFREAGYGNVEAYQQNSVSIRVRIIDEKFRGLTKLERMDLVEPVLEGLPEPVQRQVIFCLPITEDDRSSLEYGLMNLEFEQPLPSRL